MIKPFDPEELCARVRAALRTKAVRDELNEQATRDPLTGLFNRRQLDVLADEALAAAQRYGRSLSCLMIDLDGFKGINDTHGHAAGDAVLRETARRFKTSCRAADVLGRYGGEEFVVLLRETGPKGAIAVSDKLHTALAAAPVDLGSSTLVVTTSIGVAALDSRTTTRPELYAAADAALYRAKELGRNRTEVLVRQPSGMRLKAPRLAADDR